MRHYLAQWAILTAVACTPPEPPKTVHAKRATTADEDDAKAIKRAQHAKRMYDTRGKTAELRQAYFDAVDRLPHTKKTRRVRLRAALDRLIATFRDDVEPYDATVNLLHGKRANAVMSGTDKKRELQLNVEREHCYVVLTGNYLFSGLTLTRGNYADVQQFKSGGFHGFCASADAAIKARLPRRQSEHKGIVVVDVLREQFPPVLAYHAEADTYDTLNNCADDAFIGFFTHPIPGTIVYDDDGPVLLRQPQFNGHLDGYHLATGIASRVVHPSRTKTGDTAPPKMVPSIFSCWSISAPTTPATRAIAACTSRVDDAGAAARDNAFRAGKTSTYANEQRFNAEVAINGSCESLIARHKAGFLKKLQALAATQTEPAISEALWNEIASED